MDARSRRGPRPRRGSPRRWSRWAVAAALGCALPMLLGACRSPVLRYKRQLVVQFRTPFLNDQAVHNQVRSACAGLPGVSAVPTTGLLPTTNVVFGIEKSNDVQLAHLYTCLSRQPSVASASVDGGSNGG